MPARIKTLASPKKLYRYRSIADKNGDAANTKARKELKAIRENYVWSTNYKGMNDPMEGLYQGDDTFREKPEIWSKLFESKMAVGIVSFSESVTNELMWAHYADNMRGLCIEYDVARLLAALQDGEQLVRMTYDEEMPVIRYTGDADRLARNILSRKNHRWSQEREWRLMTNRLREVHYDDPSCITQIIIGPNMDDDQMDQFRSLETEYDVRLIHVDGYKLTVRDFEDLELGES